MWKVQLICQCLLVERAAKNVHSIFTRKLNPSTLREMTAGTDRISYHSSQTGINPQTSEKRFMHESFSSFKCFSWNKFSNHNLEGNPFLKLFLHQRLHFFLVSCYGQWSLMFWSIYTCMNLVTGLDSLKSMDIVGKLLFIERLNQ